MFEYDGTPPPIDPVMLRLSPEDWERLEKGRPGPATAGPDEAAGLVAESAAAMLAEPIEPRQWLPGASLCRRFFTVIAAPGGAGKSTLMLTQYVALATGRPLTGERVHHRSRVLLMVFEDGREELKRRMKAVCLHHDVDPADLKGWLFVLSLNGSERTLATATDRGAPVASDLAGEIEATIKRHGIDCAIVDPWIKAAGVPENDNMATDFVCRLVAGLAERCNVAVCVIHHTRKGEREAGDIEAARGAKSLIDAARLAFMLTKMSPEEAEEFGVRDDDRWRHVRLDDGKRNLGPAEQALWFRLGGMLIGNGTGAYPDGDHMGFIDPWRRDGNAAGGFVEAIDRRTRGQEAEAAFLAALAEAAAAGMDLTEKKTGAYAPRALKAFPPAAPFRLSDLETAMASLFASGRIRLENYGPPSRCRKRIATCHPNA